MVNTKNYNVIFVGAYQTVMWYDPSLSPYFRGSMIKSISKGSQKNPASRVKFHLPRKRYKQLYSKAAAECPTASPVHDIMELLLEYYLENEFVLSRKMILVNDPEITDKTLRSSRAYIAEKNVLGDQVDEVVIWMRIEKPDSDKFTKKARRDGASRNFIMNLLVDFYLKNRFIIRTKIIRLNRGER